MIGHVQRRATNAHIKKSELIQGFFFFFFFFLTFKIEELIQVEKRKRGKGISKITLVEVTKKRKFQLRK